MTPQAAVMEKKLRDELQTNVVQVKDLSDECGPKFDIVAASTRFKDMGFLDRHKLMHKILESDFQHAHAITLHTFSMEEYEKNVEFQLPKKRVLDEMEQI